MDPDARIAVVAERQLGLFTTAQAREAAFSQRQIDLRVAREVWDRVRPGVFRLRGIPRSQEQEVMAALLIAGPGSIASHRTAATLWELPIEAGDAIEITVPLERRCRVLGVVAHRSGTLHEHDLSVVSGIPTSSPARTLVDLSSSVGVDELGRALDDGLRRRILSLSSMHACVDRFLAISPGRSPKKLAAVMRLRVPDYDPGDSQLETDVWNIICAAGLPHPERRCNVRVGDRVLTIDLAYSTARLAIEVDGFGPHGTRRAFDIDRIRQNSLVLAGWRVLRFTSNNDAEYIADTVRRALFGHSATPDVAE